MENMKQFAASYSSIMMNSFVTYENTSCGEMEDNLRSFSAVFFKFFFPKNYLLEF